MMLRIAPHLVREHTSVESVDWGQPFEPATRGWVTRERSTPGHIGYPKFATAEKGETLFRVFADDVARFLERVVTWDGKSWDG